MMDDLRKFAKDIGQEDWFDALYGRAKIVIPTGRSTKAEIRYRKKRRAKDKIIKASRRKNRR